MFSTGVESINDLDVDAGGVLLPARFLWPYGGKRVFLTGSFTSWREHLPMSPVEGCPTAFQAFCSLPPGLHQYKYYVDGEWRHDEHQPFVIGSYGIANTLLLSRDVDQMHPTMLNTTTHGRGMYMDVDSGCSHHSAVQLDHEIKGQPVIPVTDVQISRSRICDFLSTHPAYDLLPDSGKVIALDVDMPVKQSFHVLHEQGIPVAPLWDSSRGQFVGVLSPLDFILILKELETHASNLSEEEVDRHTILEWKEHKRRLCGTNNVDKSQPLGLVHASPYDSLKDIAVRILQSNVSTVPVIHSSSSDGSFPQLLHVASLCGVLRCVCRYFKHSAGSLPILNQPISMFPLGTWVPKVGDPGEHPLAMLKPNASVGSALQLLVQAQVSSIPIVDDNDSLLDVYCRSDIMALAKDKAYAHMRLDEMSIHQALQLGQDTTTLGFFNGLRCQMCLRSDPFLKVMERLAIPGVRRVVIVEAGSKRVEGIISLSDIFKFILG